MSCEHCPAAGGGCCVCDPEATAQDIAAFHADLARMWTEAPTEAELDEMCRRYERVLEFRQAVDDRYHETVRRPVPPPNW